MGPNTAPASQTFSASPLSAAEQAQLQSIIGGSSGYSGLSAGLGLTPGQALTPAQQAELTAAYNQWGNTSLGGQRGGTNFSQSGVNALMPIGNGYSLGNYGGGGVSIVGAGPSGGHNGTDYLYNPDGTLKSTSTYNDNQAQQNIAMILAASALTGGALAAGGAFAPAAADAAASGAATDLGAGLGAGVDTSASGISGLGTGTYDSMLQGGTYATDTSLVPAAGQVAGSDIGLGGTIADLTPASIAPAASVAPGSLGGATDAYGGTVGDGTAASGYTAGSSLPSLGTVANGIRTALPIAGLVNRVLNPPTATSGTSVGTAGNASGLSGLSNPFATNLTAQNEVGTVGNMGTRYTPEALKQLDGSVMGATPMYSNPDLSNPTAMQGGSALNALAMAEAAQYGTPFAGGPGTVFAARGGSIRRYDDGGCVAPSSAPQGNDLGNALNSALAQLSDTGFDLRKLGHPNVAVVGGMGAPYHPHVLPQLAQVLQQRGMQLAHGGEVDHKVLGIAGPGSLADGGRPALHYQGAPDDHHPEFITGVTGNYVRGKGTGQSDDIPAMLADGEWVADADMVSALGDGSNKAGAKVLDAMREAIRAHKRSAPLDKIPPKAKSVVEYLKDGLRANAAKPDHKG